jgi:hypothetical protein
VAKLVPIQRTTGGFCGSERQTVEGESRKARFVHQKATHLKTTLLN